MTNPFALNTPAAPVAAPVAPVASPTPVAAPVAPDPFGGGEDPFSGPAPQRPRGPRMRELHGRLLLLRPLSVEKVKQDQDDGTSKMVDRMTTDVIVLDGTAIAYGGTPEKLPPVPHNMTAPIPFKIDSMFISSVGIVSQCREALEARRQGKPGMVLGRLTTGQAKSDKHNPPYLLTPFNDADKAIARQYLSQVDPFA
jgi:hypothetical protein